MNLGLCKEAALLCFGVTVCSAKHRFIMYKVVFVLILVSVSVSNIVAAHEIRPAIVDINYVSSPGSPSGDAELMIDILINLESIIAQIGPEHEDTDASPNSVHYQTLRAMQQKQLATEFNQFENSFISSLRILSAGGTVLPVYLESVEIPVAGDTAIPRDSKIKLRVPLSNGAAAITWQWSSSFGEAIVRATSNVQEMDFAVLLSPGQKSDPIRFTQTSKLSVRGILSNYIVVGFEHILPKGLDHILFVVGLFLLAPSWRPLAMQITTFTVAHSITLALGTAGLLRLSPSIVEPLIALSIVFVCVENFLTARVNKWRIATVFGFGLLHGLGFASVLEEVGLASNNFVIALLGFNVGVELGQLFVVAACLLLVGIWFGSKQWYRSRISQPASLIVGCIGAYWFMQRTIFA